MKSDSDDPNNHAPPVRPGDDWGDLDEVSYKPQEGLPSRRPDRGIPSNKQIPSPVIKRHASKPKLQEDSLKSPLEPRIGLREKSAEPVSVDPTPPEEPPRKAAKKTARKSPVKSATAAPRMIVENAAPTDSVKNGSREKDVSVGVMAADAERIVLPAAQSEKSLRVKEINPAREVTDKRIRQIAPKTAVGAQETEDKKAGRPRRRFARGESAQWGAKQVSGSLKWILYTGIGVIVLVVAAVLSKRSSQGDSGKPLFYGDLIPEDSYQESESDEPETLRMLIKGEDEVKRIFAVYATSGSVDDFMGLVYRSEQNVDAIAKAWKPLGVGPGWKPDQEAVWTVLEQEGTHYGVLSGSLPDFSAFIAYFRLEGGILKLDWKATTGHCSADFAELMQGKGDGGEIRALLSPGEFHTLSLPEGEFRCFRLLSPNRQDNLWAYTKIGEKLDGEIISQFIPRQISGEASSEITVVLKLKRGPDGSLPNQWIITKLVRLNWLDK